LLCNGGLAEARSSNLETLSYPPMPHNLDFKSLKVNPWQATHSKTKAHFRLVGVRAEKNLGPTLSIFGLLFGPKLLINARTLMSGY
jgi:hypothetical protein